MNESWTQLMEIIESKLQSVSFKAWFSNLELVEKTDDTLIMKIDQQFKKDFTFIRKNIDNGIDDIDFKGFKKKLNAIYKKGEEKEKDKEKEK